MAGLSWFELDIDFHRHPKTVALQVELRNPTAEAYVSRIWAYCYHNAVDRFEGAAAVATVEQAAEWKGKTGRLVSALLLVRYLERQGDALVAHGVAERLGPHLKAKRAAAERQQRRRDKLAGVTGDVTEDVTRDEEGDVRRTSAVYRDKDSNQKIHQAASDADARLAEFRVALGSRLAKPPDWFRLSSAENVPDTRTRLDAEFLRLGVERAADVAAERARKDGKVNRWLRWYLGPLAEAHRDPLPEAAPTEPLPAPDPAWLAAHPGAAERWAAYEHEVMTKEPIDRRAKQLEGALFMLKAEFAEVA